MRVAWFIDNLTGNSMVFGLIKLLLQKMKLWLMMNLKVIMLIVNLVHLMKKNGGTIE